VRFLLAVLEADWTSTHAARRRNDKESGMVSTAGSRHKLALYVQSKIEYLVHSIGHLEHIGKYRCQLLQRSDRQKVCSHCFFNLRTVLRLNGINRYMFVKEILYVL